VQGQRQLLQLQLEERFGPLGPGIQEAIQSLPAERLRELARAVVRVQSLQELRLEEQATESAS